MSRPESYPWDDWFRRIGTAGSSLRLQHGVDFQVPTVSMQKMFAAKARSRGLTVATEMQNKHRFLKITPTVYARYPWDKWLDGETYALRPGIDFRVPLEVMRGSAKRAAKSRDLELRTRSMGGALYVQALGPAVAG